MSTPRQDAIVQYRKALELAEETGDVKQQVISGEAFTVAGVHDE
jgi:hypothetical protein